MWRRSRSDTYWIAFPYPGLNCEYLSWLGPTKHYLACWLETREVMCIFLKNLIWHFVWNITLNAVSQGVQLILWCSIKGLQYGYDVIRDGNWIENVGFDVGTLWEYGYKNILLLHGNSIVRSQPWWLTVSWWEIGIADVLHMLTGLCRWYVDCVGQ